MREEVPIAEDTIRLGQLLKLADIVMDGGEARALIGDGQVRVNGEVELRRGRQLRDGDEVTCGPRTVVVRGPGAGRNPAGPARTRPD